MTPTDVGPAIARVLMLAAGPLDSEADLDAVTAGMHAFDGDPEALEQLIVALAVHVNAKVPHGGSLVMTDAADLAAFALVTAGAHPAHVARMAARLPPNNLGDVATALLAFWRQACQQVTAAALADVQVPDHLPKETP